MALLPFGLVLRPSSILGQGMGVWTGVTDLPGGTRMGPLEGQIIASRTGIKPPTSDHTWDVSILDIISGGIYRVT